VGGGPSIDSKAMARGPLEPVEPVTRLLSVWQAASSRQANAEAKIRPRKTTPRSHAIPDIDTLPVRRAFFTGA
jgi:hypothetical protein